MTSFMGTGMYFRASIATTSPICLSDTGGRVRKEIRLDERGNAEPQDVVVVFASLKISLSAAASLSAGSCVARPTSVPAYGPSANSPYVLRTARPCFFFISTTFIDDEPMSIPSTLCGLDTNIAPRDSKKDMWILYHIFILTNLY